MHSELTIPVSMPTSPHPRLPVVGINSNLTVRGETYHVQTEDLAPRQSQLVTHVFSGGGHVIKVSKVDYSKHLERSDLHAVLTRVTKVFHAKVLRSLQRQRLESIPPSVALRASVIPPAKSEPDGLVSAPPPSQIRASSPMRPATLAELLDTQQDAKKDSANAEPPQSVACVWDRIIQNVQRERQTVTTATRAGDEDESVAASGPESSPGLDAPAPASSSWERAVSRMRQVARSGKTEALPEDPDPAFAAYDEGIVAMRRGAHERAVVSLARAVELMPQNARYRAALRRALDAMEES